MSDERTYTAAIAGDISGDISGDIGKETAAAMTLKAGDIGVSAPTVTKDSRGRWLPGVSGNPAGGRPKAQETAYLNAIKLAVPPEQVTEYLRKALDLAVKQNSARGIIAVLEFIRDTTLGTPVRRTVTATTKLESIISWLGEMSDDEFDAVEQAMRK